jgi:signal transduction histidine kinase
MRRTTLRTRATVLATVITGITLLVASVALVVTLDSRLTAGADDLSRSRVNDLLDLAASGDLPATLTNVSDDGVAQVVGADGRVVAASPNIEGRPRITTFDPGPELAVRTLDGPDDQEIERYRLWAGSGDSPDGPVTVYVGSSLESVHEASATLRRSLLVGGPLVLLLLAAGTWLVLGGALRRVDRIRTEVDAITEDRLDRRVPESDVDDEVGRLAATMNRMLGRLEAARTRQRAFVADVSHDLQSPLAAQRTELEVARAHPESTDLDRLTGDLLATNAEMEHLVRDLLFLAAADAGAPPAPPTALDLEDVVLEEAERARAGTGLRVDTSAVSAAPTYANRAEVQRIVRNLLDNALAHAAARVELRVSNGPGGARFDVVDDGAGVAPEERDRIFDRFHRGDTARSRHTSGSGLGLAIARTLAERNGGGLELGDRDTGGDIGGDTGRRTGAHFVLRLPGVAGH